MTIDYSDVFQMATSAEQIEAVFHTGKISSLIGLEGGHSIDSSLAALRMFYNLGARCTIINTEFVIGLDMTLTSTCNTPWAQSSTDEDIPQGISEFGLQVVAEMNRLGMIVDLSNTAVTTQLAVLNASEAPVLFSNSNVYECFYS